MILVTGGTGLLGSHLIYQLVRKGEKVRVLIRNHNSKDKLYNLLESIYGDFLTYSDNLEIALGDITNYYSLTEAFKEIKYVYHCAAVVSFNDTHSKEILETNIRGTANVVNACLHHHTEKLIHVSSIAAVDSSLTEEEIITENSGWPTSKNLNYAYSKTESEFEVWRGISEGLNAVIVNPSVILGEGEFNTGSGLLFKRVYKGLKYYTNGITGYVDVKDVVRIMISLMKSKLIAERYILNADNLTYKDFFKKVAEALHVKAPSRSASRYMTETAWRLEKIRSIIFLKEPVLTKKAARTSHEKIKYSSAKIIESLGFTFTPINDTIKRVANYYQKTLNT